MTVKQVILYKYLLRINQPYRLIIIAPAEDLLSMCPFITSPVQILQSVRRIWASVCCQQSKSVRPLCSELYYSPVYSSKGSKGY